MTGVLMPGSSPDGPDGGRRQLRPLTPRTAFRIAVLGVIAMGVLGVLLVRLWFLQVIGGQAYAQRASENVVRTIVTPAPRGLITDRNGVVLAQNRPSMDVVAFPRELRDDPTKEDTPRKRAMGQLSRILGVPRRELLDTMRSAEIAYPYQPAVLARDVPLGVAAPLAERIRELHGIELRDGFVREYPQGELAAHVLGYTGAIQESQWPDYKARGYQRNDRVGVAGVEAEYEQYLRGVSGQRQVEVDAFGDQVGREFGTRPPEQGKNLTLTIDVRVQRALEDQLRERYALSGTANGAAGVAMDPHTGEVLAMASYPPYAPNAYARGLDKVIKAYNTDKRSPMLNRAVNGLPPASTFKPITALSAQEEGILKPTEFLNSPSKMTIFKTVFKNFRGASHGEIQLPTALEVSSDTYFYQVGARFWTQRRYQQQYRAQQFGFGAPTRIDLPGESGGRVPTPAWKKEHFKNLYPDEAQWKGGDDINMAVGQGNLLATPLQMADAYAAIANGGSLLTPVIGRAITDQSGTVLRRITPARPPRSLNIPASALAPVRAGLELVTSGADGTAVGAFGPARAAGAGTFAGKTGTAENKPHPDHAWFVGYAPAADPRIVVAVVVENGGTGAVVAAPAVCRTIAAYDGTRFNPDLCGVPADKVTD